MAANRPYGDWNPLDAKKYPTEKEVDAIFGGKTEMQNKLYSRLVEGYLLCVSTYLS